MTIREKFYGDLNLGPFMMNCDSHLPKKGVVRTLCAGDYCNFR